MASLRERDLLHGSYTTHERTKETVLNVTKENRKSCPEKILNYILLVVLAKKKKKNPNPSLLLLPTAWAHIVLENRNKLSGSSIHAPVLPAQYSLPASPWLRLSINGTLR